MIKAVIFDCFGVLVGRGFDETYSFAGGDSHQDHEFIEALLESANRGQISQTIFRQKICEHLDIEPEVYEDAVKRAEQLNLELLEYIKTLHKKYKTAILSNVNSGVLERKIGQERLKECFDEWVASAEAGYIKPEAQIYHHTAELLGAKPDECVFIDDREVYTAAAEKLGMKTILYRDFKQMKTELEKILAADASGPNN